MFIYHIGHKGKTSTKGRSCKGKRRYYNKEEAKRTIIELYRKNKAFGKFNIYRCKFCEKKGG